MFFVAKCFLSYTNCLLIFVYTVTAFVLFVGVVFPLVVLGLWIFWECCRETDRDQSEDEEESR